MTVSYQHANPYAGNESFLLRFADADAVDQSRTPCVLVDAGTNVDVETLLGEDDYLAAIVLTHAHADHYQSLAANLRDGAPIYTSEATARILEPILTDAQRHADDGLGDIEAAIDALEPIDGWVSPVEGLRLGPVPAGHTPGAIGVLIQFNDSDDKYRTILATGDWTSQQVAGYPGIETALPVDVEAIFLTGVRDDSYPDPLTESVGTIYERAASGSSVLVSASALMGVQYAYLLGHLGEALEQPYQITLVGQAAKLAISLDYDVPNVETVPDFERPDDVLTPGTITIAGPESPTGGSSGRLFGAIRNNPSATLVQIRSGSGEKITSARCSTHDFRVVPHPSSAEVDELVENFNPTQVVITHQRGQATERFKEQYNSYVWTTDDTNPYTLFSDGEWTPPEWMSSAGRSYVHRSNSGGRGLWLGDAIDLDSGEIPLPSCSRITESVDLDREGLDMDTLRHRLRPVTTATEIERESEAEAEVATDAESETANEAITDEVTADRDSLPAETSEIMARLDAIEAELAGPTVPVRVIDAGDGVQLLRVLDANLDVEHGDTIEVTPRRSVASMTEVNSDERDPRQDSNPDGQQTETDVSERETQD